VIRSLFLFGLVFSLASVSEAKLKLKKTNGPSPLDKFIQEANANSAKDQVATSPGSLFRAGTGGLTEMARDIRAGQVNDIVTIVVADKASALNKGTTSSSRKSSTKNAVTSIFGPTKAGGALANLAAATGDTQLQGTGTTSRDSSLTTTLSARVAVVLSNGYLVVDGLKDISVNSERQTVHVRGILRPSDLNALNQVASDRLAMLEIKVDGKGVVGDAVRRPMFLYRLLLGLMPF
jgi:flagellar L-ring protein FlgH